MFTTKDDAVRFIYSSYMRALDNVSNGQRDRDVRHPNFTRELLDKLDKPDKNQENILVTGSKGKGSISRMISKILEGQGKKVGLFTSPHLIDFNERIRINGIAISDEDLVKYVNIIYPYVMEMEKTMANDTYIGPVGIAAIIASLYFRDNGTDINVFECGRGARYDDVNMISSKWSAINAVFVEHVPEVGANIEEIAYNKAGVIKQQQRGAYVAKQFSEVMEVIKRQAEETKVPLKVYGEDFIGENISITRDGTTFDVVTSKEQYRSITMPLLGRHQVNNGALAIALTEDVLEGLDTDKLRISFKEMFWPGRLEIIDNEPLTILDGCINRECSIYIRETLEVLGEGPIVGILAIPDNKDFEGVFAELSDLFDTMIITRAANAHLTFTNEQYKVGQKYINNCLYINNVEEAVEKGKELLQGKGILCIVGTQSLIKDVKLVYNQDTRNLI